jgi:hypothetical protein
MSDHPHNPRPEWLEIALALSGEARRWAPIFILAWAVFSGAVPTLILALAKLIAP